ncbi:MAG: glycosyltransferase involved in cell wall biosynthesis [Patiriisocius sp.]|jgi:glycosyltransferase involved in cell wall biosynthesis
MPKSPDTVVILDQASGYLKIDMLEAYAEKYSKRVILAGTIVTRGTALSPDIKWHKVPVYNRTNGSKRILSWLRASFAMFWIVLTKYRKAHIVALTNPPLAIFIPWLLGCSYDIIIYDLYPDALVHYGYAKKEGLIYRIWASFNKKAFKKARKVFTLTEGLKRLASGYLEDKEIEVVPLWSEASDFSVIKKEDNLILQEVGAQGKFVIVYSGNLGLTHPVEKLIELGDYLDEDKFAIIIIGGGAKQKRLEKLIFEKGHKHVTLLPWQPIDKLAHNLYAADINVVTLDSIASDLSIPSKTFNILSIGNPVLGICSEYSGLAELIKTYDCGFISDGKDMRALADKLRFLETNRAQLQVLRKNSLKASLNFTKKNATAFVN